jgi:hypothetical protein
MLILLGTCTGDAGGSRMLERRACSAMGVEDQGPVVGSSVGVEFGEGRTV